MNTNLKIENIKDKIKFFNSMSAEETIKFRNEWKEVFAVKDLTVPMHMCRNCRDYIEAKGGGYDWHAFSYAEIDNCETYLNEIDKVITKNDEDIIIF